MSLNQHTIEQDLRTAMHAGPPPATRCPDPLTRIEDRITSRRRRRLLATSVLGVLLIGTASAAVITTNMAPPPAASAAITGTEPVAAPQIQRRSPRPDRQPCQLDRVDSLEWIVQSAPWGPSTGFALRPNNSERCTLSGQPLLSGTNIATGVSEPVAAVSIGPLDNSITRQFPATIDPGEPARIHIRGNTTCPDGQQPQSYRDLVLTAGGKQLRLPGFRTLTSVCGADVSPWFIEPPMEYAALNATVQTPPALHPGQNFTYTVRIDNVFPHAYPLPSCPVYRLSVAATETEEWQRISCTQTSIAAHSSIQFTLQGRIPADLKPGQHKLTWMALLTNGEAAIADMATSGTTITITS